MRKPNTIEWLYLDFDGYFASVHQQVKPHLRDKPVGVIPFEKAKNSCVIACSKEAKALGCKNVMNIDDALQVCPELILVPQSPDLYRRAHNALLSEIRAVIPIDAIKSIDELTCKLDERQRGNPELLARQIKDRLAQHIGKYITCSIGFAANRQLAKIACKQDKPNGCTIWTPDMVPQALYDIPFDDIPGIGSRMEKRLYQMSIFTTKDLLALSPKHMRKIWRNVTGERLWYALQGYAIQAQLSERSMFGHSRVLPPESREQGKAYDIARILIVKAARRMRKAGFCAGRFYLWCGFYESSYSDELKLATIEDYQACLAALKTLWERMRSQVNSKKRMMRVSVSLGDLSLQGNRQLDLLHNDDPIRQKWEKASRAVDVLNSKYSSSIVTLGEWSPPKGGNVGGKISYTRIPSAEDFF